MFYYRVPRKTENSLNTVYFFVIDNIEKLDQVFLETILGRYYSEVYFLSSIELNGKLEQITRDDVLALEKNVRVYVYKDEQGVVPNISIEFLNIILNFNLKYVQTIDAEYKTEDYLRPKLGGNTPKLLYVFPGSIYPRTLGSHQRAITILLSLLKMRVDVDIVYTAGSKRVRKSIKPILNLMSSNAVPYNNKNSFLPRYPRVNRHLSAWVTRFVSVTRSAFQRLIFKKVTLDLKQQIKELTTKNNYDYVLFNYAWMLPARSVVQGDAKIICDTHDIQFFRTEETEEKDKKLEIDLLNQCDKVITISHRDEEILSEYLPSEKIETVVSPFNYLGKYAHSLKKTSFEFGFLGHNMDANVQALELVIEKWWPVIQDYSPDSKLYIAGSICKNPKLKELVFLRRNIELLGFVDSLNAFYMSIDILLSPVVVRGGLNFKNAEALATGKVLITNKNGADALKPINVPYTFETAEEVVEYLSLLELGDREVLENLKKSTQEFYDNFSDETVLNCLTKVFQ